MKALKISGADRKQAVRAAQNVDKDLQGAVIFISLRRRPTYSSGTK